MNNIVVIADDLTGAADTGVQFFPYFDDTTLIPYHRLVRIAQSVWTSSSQALAVYTNSRALSSAAANQRVSIVAQSLAWREASWIYKKIDSCMRGNVGAEVDALLDLLEFDVSFITPAFPEMGRTTCDDIHLVHGTPLAETEIAGDPISPVRESRLSLIVQGSSKHSVGHIGLKLLERKPDRLNEEIQQQIRSGIRHIVFDVLDRDHLDWIAKFVFTSQMKILSVGSAGLAGSIARLLETKPAADVSVNDVNPESRNLFVCGTTSVVTRQQIDTLQAQYPYDVIQLEARLLAGHGGTTTFAEKVSSVSSRLLKKNVILTIQPQPKKRSPANHKVSSPSPELVVNGLGRFVADVVANSEPGNLFLSGGDTADAVFSAVQADGIRILGEVVAGVVRGVLLSGMLDGTPVVTKAGAFGDRNTLVRVHNFGMGLAEGS